MRGAAAFSEQLDVLAEERRVVSLDELAVEREPGTVAITFDDGYRDNATNAAPALAARGLPWTLFASTGHVEDGRPFWWDEVNRVFAAAPAGSGTASSRWPSPGASAPGGRRQPEGRERARAAVLAALQAVDAETINNALNSLGAGAKAPPSGDEPVAMTVEDLRTLSRPRASRSALTRAPIAASPTRRPACSAPRCNAAART